MSAFDWIMAFLAFVTVELTIGAAYIGLNVTVAKVGEIAAVAKESAEKAHERIDNMLGFRRLKR